jgi:hypothetical protein
MFEPIEYDEAIKKFASERKENNVITNTVEDSTSIVQYFIKYTNSNILYIIIPDLTYDLLNKLEVISAIEEYLSRDKEKRIVLYVKSTDNTYCSLFKVLIQYSSQVILRCQTSCKLAKDNSLKLIIDGQKSYIYIRDNYLRCNFCDENFCQRILQHIEVIKRSSNIVSLL